MPNQVYNAEIGFVSAADHPSLRLKLSLRFADSVQTILDQGLLDTKAVAGQQQARRFNFAPNDITSGQTVEFQIDVGTDPLEIAIGFDADFL